MSDYILRCITCKKEYEPVRDRYTCDDCGRLMGTLEVIYDYERIKRYSVIKQRNYEKKEAMYQFSDLLPTRSKNEFDEYIGRTPLYKFDVLGLEDVMFKYDGGNPSSSYKDRASSVAINMALHFGYKVIFCASTGNAASSLSILTAQTKLKTYIFVPSAIPLAKLTQLQISSAKVMLLDCSYDDVFDLSLELGIKKGWYCRHSAINPYLVEGKKTGAFEIIVQNDYNVPDYVIVSVGDGTIISSLYKGFWEFKEIELIDTIPKMIGVQAEGMAAVKAVFDKGKPYKPIKITGETIADSISVGSPRDVIKACTYVEASGGYFITLTDNEIIDSIAELGKITGLLAEPAGAAPYGGLKKLIYEEKIKETDSVCLVITGNVLKDISSVKSLVHTKTIPVEDVEKWIAE